MANNGIYLRCRGCGDTLFLGSSMLHGFYYQENKRINELPLAAADLIDEDSCTFTLQGWIFTKDAQPSEAGMYLAFADSLFPKGKLRIGTYYWTGSDWLDMLHIPRKVSHWMPLPDPPEGIWL